MLCPLCSLANSIQIMNPSRILFKILSAIIVLAHFFHYSKQSHTELTLLKGPFVSPSWKRPTRIFCLRALVCPGRSHISQLHFLMLAARSFVCFFQMPFLNGFQVNAVFSRLNSPPLLLPIFTQIDYFSISQETKQWLSLSNHIKAAV